MHKFAELEKRLETILSQHDDGSDASHGIQHARRVQRNAAEIADREGSGDMKLLTAGAFLHDLVSPPKNSPQRKEASRLSADAAGPLLGELGFNETEVAAVQHMILAHSFSANIPPETLEAKILQDADRLEAVGALGIARTFYVAGKMSSELFHGKDPFAEKRELEDSRFAVDHFKTKLLGLADTMQTAAGRNIATEHRTFMLRFLDQLASEIGETNPWG